MDVVAKAVKICRPSAVPWSLGVRTQLLRAAVFEEMPELDAAIVGEGEQSCAAAAMVEQAGSKSH